MSDRENTCARVLGSRNSDSGIEPPRTSWSRCESTAPVEERHQRVDHDEHRLLLHDELLEQWQVAREGRRPVRHRLAFVVHLRDGVEHDGPRSRSASWLSRARWRPAVPDPVLHAEENDRATPSDLFAVGPRRAGRRAGTAQSSVAVDLSSPGSPSSTTSFPSGSRPGHRPLDALRFDVGNPHDSCSHRQLRRWGVLRSANSTSGCDPRARARRARMAASTSLTTRLCTSARTTGETARPRRAGEPAAATSAWVTGSTRSVGCSTRSAGRTSPAATAITMRLAPR